ncbi:MAG: hypothetical protein ACRDB1_07200, partial [Microcoleaceae cyanobacterium]
SVQQLATDKNIDASTMQTVMSTVGGFLRPALQQQKSLGGMDQLQNLIGQVAGGGGAGGGLGMLSSLLAPQLQGQIVEKLAQTTGLSPSILEGVVSSVLPGIMGLFNMGGSFPGAKTENPLLASFLDSDNDKDVDLGDVLKFANRFMNPAR